MSAIVRALVVGAALTLGGASAIAQDAAKPAEKAAAAQDVPKAKQTKLGKYVTAKEAADIVKAERDKVVFIDVRTRAELQFVGWTPEIDGAVPFVDMSQFGEWDDKNARYKLEPNPTFSEGIGKLVAAKKLGRDAKILLMCRSGDRSARGVDALADAGYSNVYSVIDGFEGDLSKDDRRTVNGWKNSGLAWTYKLDKAKVFQSAQ